MTVMDNPMWWPSILKVDEVAALLGVTTSALQRRLTERRIQLRALSGKRFLRSEVISYLSNPDQVSRDWGHVRRKADAAPVVIPGGPLQHPVTDLQELPVLMKIRDMAILMRVSASVIRRNLSTFEMVPPPIATRPLRWSKFDVERYLKHASDIADWRRTEVERERTRLAKERAHLQGDPLTAYARLQSGIEDLAERDGPLTERLAALAAGPLAAVRLIDLPLHTRRYWKHLETLRSSDIATMATHDATVIAKGLISLTRQVRLWIQSERPEVPLF